MSTPHLWAYTTQIEKERSAKLLTPLVRKIAAMPERGLNPFGVSRYVWEWAARERNIPWVASSQKGE